MVSDHPVHSPRPLLRFTAAVFNKLTPFPTLFAEQPEKWHWPVPPFVWRHRPPPSLDVAQPCRIESVAGTAVEGEMLGFEPSTRTLTFRSSAAGPVVELPFSRFRRLTLTAPLEPAVQSANMPIERVPAGLEGRLPR